jgi:hypothetical protein
MPGSPNHQLEELLYAARVTPPNPPQTPSKKRGCGCFTSVGGAILLTLLVTLLVNPWSLHMGGRWTPALTWHGVGLLKSSTGTTYGIFIEVSPHLQHGRGASNLNGRARLCTPQGEIYPLTVNGYLKRAWLDADGTPITFYLRSPKGAQPKLNFDLLGAWRGRELVLDDKGTMAMSFSADGNAKGYLQGQNAPKENTTGSLRYATESEFSTVCGDKAKNSF